jgi:plastocyanin
MMMRPLPIALVLALVLAAPAAAATKKVTVDDDFFVRSGSPPTVSVKKGTTVRFEWAGSRQHNIVTVDGPGKAKVECGLRRSGICERKPRRVGTYKLQCSIHAPDMAMTLRVKRR